MRHVTRIWLKLPVYKCKSVAYLRRTKFDIQIENLIARAYLSILQHYKSFRFILHQYKYEKATKTVRMKLYAWNCTRD